MTPIISGEISSYDDIQDSKTYNEGLQNLDEFIQPNLEDASLDEWIQVSLNNGQYNPNHKGPDGHSFVMVGSNNDGPKSESASADGSSFVELNSKVVKSDESLPKKLGPEDAISSSWAIIGPNNDGSKLEESKDISYFDSFVYDQSYENHEDESNEDEFNEDLKNLSQNMNHALDSKFSHQDSEDIFGSDYLFSSQVPNNRYIDNKSLVSSIYIKGSKENESFVLDRVKFYNIGLSFNSSISENWKKSVPYNSEIKESFLSDGLLLAIGTTFKHINDQNAVEEGLVFSNTKKSLNAMISPTDYNLGGHQGIHEMDDKIDIKNLKEEPSVQADNFLLTKILDHIFVEKELKESKKSEKPIKTSEDTPSEKSPVFISEKIKDTTNFIDRSKELFISILINQNPEVVNFKNSYLRVSNKNVTSKHLNTPKDEAPKDESYIQNKIIYKADFEFFKSDTHDIKVFYNIIKPQLKDEPDRSFSFNYLIKNDIETKTSVFYKKLQTNIAEPNKVNFKNYDIIKIINVSTESFAPVYDKIVKIIDISSKSSKKIPLDKPSKSPSQKREKSRKRRSM